jgi:hypothetical protein
MRSGTPFAFVNLTVSLVSLLYLTTIPGVRGTTTKVTMAFSKINAAEKLMKQVYGDWDVLLDQKLFPRPLPEREAGPSCVKWGEGEQCQRRYLWTDAFGVLNFVTMAQRYPESRRAVLLDAARQLIDSVHATLGQPRSPTLPMAAQADGTPYGYRGLRIGKVNARTSSDAGMEYDGMYWHYLDKWCFALLRYHQVSGDVGALRQAVHLIKTLHPAFMHKSGAGKPLGLRWKVNTDLTPIAGLGQAYPNDDALSGYLMYTLVRHASVGQDVPSIDQECDELGEVARQYILSGVRLSADPLGYGLWGWKCQWLGAEWSGPIRDRLRALAPTALDLTTGMALPFRLYGALLGAQLVPGSPGLKDAAERVLASGVVEYEMGVPVGGEEGHSCINKVMLASALDPLAFARLAGEPCMAVLTGRGHGEEEQL